MCEVKKICCAVDFKKTVCVKPVLWNKVCVFNNEIVREGFFFYLKWEKNLCAVIIISVDE